jgi:Amt family ammonium transporter
MTGFLATPEANANLALNLKDIVGHTLWLHQLAAMGVTVAMAAIGTAVIACIVKFTIGLRPSVEEEVQGLDILEHGEEGYILEEKS